MNLYEQQSTFNPNMPLRLLDYAVTLFKKFIEMSKKNIFGRTLIHLPVPRLVVFYNGTIDMPEEMELKLSDAFPPDLRDLSDIEVRVRMININAGKNRKLLEACKPLHEYSWIVDTIRNNKSRFKKMNDDKEILEMAIDKTLDTMPDSFLLKPFLEAHRAEVKGMLFDEYNEEKIRNLFKEEGRQEGENRFAQLIEQLLKDKRFEDVEKATTDTTFRDKLYNEFQIA